MGNIDPASVLATILTTYVFGVLGIGIAAVLWIMALVHSIRSHNFHSLTHVSLGVLLWFGARTLWNTLGIAIP